MLELSDTVELRLRQQAWRARTDVSAYLTQLIQAAEHPEVQRWLPGYAQLSEEDEESPRARGEGQDSEDS